MPELPEVRTVSYHLNKRLQGLTIKEAIINLDKIIKDITPLDFKKKVKGQKILSVTNEGKWIVFNLTNDLHIIVHLRLEGKFRTQKDIPGIKPIHDHVIIEFTNGTKLYFNDTRQFGTFHLQSNDYKEIKPLNQLGKHLDQIDVQELFNKFKKKSIPIKSTMLDQTIIIGLGNIYINEALWYIKLHPETPTNKVTLKQLKELIDISHKIMEESYKLGGSSIATYSSLDGLKGKYQEKLKVHGKVKKPCARCKTPLIKIKVGGRGTYMCSNCQKKM